MDITIAKEGWRFVLSCLERYQGEGWFLIWFVCALVYLGIGIRREKDTQENSQRAMACWVIPYVIVLALTVFNVVIMRFVVAILGMEDEYYRFIWLLPVTVVIAVAASKAVLSCRQIVIRILMILALAATMIGSGKTILGREFTLAENLYKVPDEILEISQIIHEDFEQEEPKVIAEFDLVVLLNQYDPSLRLEIAYGDVSTLRDVERAPQVQWDRWLTSRLMVMQVVMDKDITILPEDFIAAMDYTDAYYLVAARDPVMAAYYEQARCVPVATTEHYTVYRYYNSVLPLPGQ